MNADLSIAQPNAIGAAIVWLQSALTGSIAIDVAVIAVAWFGLMLMSGHLSTRRGAQLILGCFIIFGASSIAAGIVDGLSGGNGIDGPSLAPPPAIAISPPPKPIQAVPYDPYAGAALPVRR